MTDKLRDYFDEMVVYKDLKNNNLSIVEAFDEKKY